MFSDEIQVLFNDGFQPIKMGYNYNANNDDKTRVDGNPVALSKQIIKNKRNNENLLMKDK